MSRPRFAAITSDLLARKGEARPWGELPKQALAWQASAPPAAPAPLAAAPSVPANFCEKPPVAAGLTQHGPHGDVKKIAVRLSHHDYERLGILAVKRCATRQRLLQEALDSLLSGLPLQFCGCACLRAED